MNLDIIDHEDVPLETAYFYGYDSVDAVDTLHTAAYRLIRER